MLALILMVCGSISGTIHIWEPKALRTKYSKSPLPYSVMNFGMVPYGHSIYGTVFKAEPVNACVPLKAPEWDKNRGTLIMLVARGGCNFSEKVLHSQDVGAGFVIITDDKEEDVRGVLGIETSKKILDKIKIPGIMISKDDGATFWEAIKTESIELAVNFAMVPSKKTAELRAMVQVDSVRCYELLDKLLGKIKKFEDNVHLQINFKIVKDLEMPEENCMTSDEHRYCFPKSDDHLPVDLPRETLRQMCILSQGVKEFAKYVRQIRKDCLQHNSPNRSRFGDCLEESRHKVFKSKQLEEQETCSKLDSIKAKTLLKNSFDFSQFSAIHYTPIIHVNGLHYKGNYDDVDHVFESVCNSFDSPPPRCSELAGFRELEEMNAKSLKKFITFALVFVCLASIFAVIIFYLLYSRSITRTFNFELNDKINEALAEYHGKEAEETSQPSEEK